MNINNPPKSTYKKVVTLLSVFLVFLSFVNIITSASLSSSGERLRELETQARELKHNNQLLEQQLVSSRSLTKISKEANLLGFTQNPQILTLTGDVTIAQVFNSELLEL